VIIQGRPHGARHAVERHGVALLYHKCVCVSLYTMSTQKEAVRQQVRLLQAHAAEEVEANQAGMI